MRIGSLFTGMGGLDVAVQAVLGGTVAWHCENNEAASKLLTHHHPHIPNLGDITTVDWTRVEPVDVLTGGFPCTDVSAAGRQEGMFDGTRSGLWSEYATAIRHLQPKLVIIENVRGLFTSRGAPPTPELLAAWAELAKCDRIVQLINSKHGKAVREQKTFWIRQHATDRARIMGRRKRAVVAARRADARIVRAIGAVVGTLASLGYDAEWHSIRASDVGAPHERWRVFLVAENTDRSTRCQRRQSAPGQAQGGRAWPDFGGSSRTRTAAAVEHADGRGRGQGWFSGVGREVGPGGDYSGDPATPADASPRPAADTAHVGHERGRGTRAGRPGPADSRLGTAPDTASTRFGGTEDGGADSGDEGTRCRGAEFERNRGPRTDADTPRFGRDERRPEPTRHSGGPHAPLSGHATTPHTGSVGLDRRESVEGERRDAPVRVETRSDPSDSGISRNETPPHTDMRDSNGRATAGQQRQAGPSVRSAVLDWGVYRPAIERWERVLDRPAPPPTVLAPKGGQRLSPAFVEWLMGAPEGWVTAVPGISRNDQLKILGNAVVAQQAEAALKLLLGTAQAEAAS